MKRIVLPLLFVIALGVAFTAGLFTQSIWMLMPSFCLWTPGIFWLGFAFAKAGKLSVSFTSEESAASNNRTRRQRQLKGEAYQ